MIQRQNPSQQQLEFVEAADFFKLDPDQINLLATKKKKPTSPSNVNYNSIFDGTDQRTSGNLTEFISGKQEPLFQAHQMSTRRDKPPQPRTQQTKKGETSNKSLKFTRDYEDQEGRLLPQRSILNGSGSPKRVMKEPDDRMLLPKQRRAVNQPQYIATDNSPAPSTNTPSLPSVSSSPSLSPSLVCPHLSLDDILQGGEGGRMSESPHTIGLCPKCRLDPPPDIQSPLSPMFRPSRSSLTKRDDLTASNPNLAPKTISTSRKASETKYPGRIRRGYSDQTQTSVKARQRLRLQPDDSIDFFLEPDEVRRLHLSPTLRNSVEFIRNNTTEAGRVIRIYKNGRPYDKPLRICVMRGEFSNLNHLLDHINSRQLIPLGARYLFHLDGQPVYSVEELKHNSIYVVSGTRSFDFKTNNVLKEQLIRERSKLPTNLQASKSRQRLYTPVDCQQSSKTTSDESLPPIKIKVEGSHFMEPTTKVQRPAKEANSSPKRVIRKSTPTQTTILQVEGSIKGSSISQMQYHKDKKGELRQLLNRTKASAKTTAPIRKSSLSKSRDSLEKLNQDTEAKPIKPMTRAKSEMSALPNKPKKNVTFVDTGRGSSPAINNITRGSSPKPVDMIGATTEKQDEADQRVREAETSEIGIQVSDSIEGFLIDLPLPLGPAQVDNGLNSRARSTAASRNKQIGANRRTMDARTNQRGKVTSGAKTKRRIVTITEHQLSFDELDTLKDMDHGDHHSEAHKPQKVSIMLNSGEDTEIPSNDKETESEEKQSVGEHQLTMIGDDEKVMVTEAVATTDMIEEGSPPEAGNSHWQYPGGRPEAGVGSATPTERPVSQSDANDVVRARVLTPSPSISTMGDSSSLAMSYEAAIVSNSSLRRQSTIDSGQVKQDELEIQKQRVPVKGKPCLGTQMPSENFQLAWINGFAVNDLYPDNSTVASMAANITSDPANKQAHRRGESPTGRRGVASSPSTLTSMDPNNQVNQFHPSERFHNWIWHSKRHDELVYPAGSIIVLWSHWTHEQRFYCKHTTSVSCLTLASLDTDLAASAQVQDPDGGPPNALVHLWSLSSLDTLRVLDDDRFRGLCLYSLKVRNTETEGCELTVAGREDKRIWLFVCFLNLKLKQNTDEPALDATRTNAKLKDRPSEAFRVLKASKPMINNQLPLAALRMSNVKGEINAQVAPTSKSSQQQSLLGDVILSFGRRHFQLWFTDRRRSELVALQPSSKTTDYCELMIRATCMARISPNELVVGDNGGNIFLLLLDNVASRAQDQTRSKETRGASKTVPKYDIETVHLYNAQAANKQIAYVAITCLSRVSGNLFASIDSTCALYFWRLERYAEQKTSVRANQLCRIQLPANLGFICSFVLSRYSRKLPSVEFYLVSTSNAILFGSANLTPAQPGSAASAASENNQSTTSCCTLSVIYEGHETSAMSLVADCTNTKQGKKKPTNGASDENYYYFTCSLDYKICKWNGKALVWKSQLPSACASLAVHPTGFVLAIGSADGTVYILDKISGLLISYFPLTPVCINCLAYSSDGSLLAAGCSNGSIFILPVYENGLKYKKVSIFQSPHPVVSLQFSMNNRYILTSVTHGAYQELILWDLPNFRYMRENVTVAADRIQWFDSICSGSEDVRAIWENANLTTVPETGMGAKSNKLSPTKRGQAGKNPTPSRAIINLSCHRLMRTGGENLAVASDTRGYIRLFRYTCSDIDQGFYESRISSSPVNCCRFLANRPDQITEMMFVSSSIDGTICLWKLTKD